MDNPTQLEDVEISPAFDLEKLDTNLFRSRRLWAPHNARGVFGGQLIANAIMSATNCVDPIYGLHSLHCYFILNASLAVPVNYHVDRIRDGQSYVTRAVRAIQNGRVLFIMLCSFHKPEPWQPSRRSSMLPNIPPPELCEDEDVLLRRLAAQDDRNEYEKKLLLYRAEERQKSPIGVRKAKDCIQDGMFVQMFWMRAKNIPNSNRTTTYQKCILGCMSDVHLMLTATQAAGLKYGQRDGPDILGLISALDHAIWFYDDDFDCGDWLLYEMRVPRVGSGQVIITGRMFTRQGTLIANVSQEGVLRARIRGAGDTNKEMSKL